MDATTKGKKIHFNFTWEKFLFILLVIEIIIFGSINPRMFMPSVLLGSVNDFLPMAITSLAVTFVLITGGMDIQAGSIIGLTSIVMGLLFQEAGVNIWLACLLGLVVGALCGLLSGTIIAFTGVQPMVITLGGSFLFSGLALSVMEISSVESYLGISGFPQSFTSIFKYRFFGIIPTQVIIFVVLIIFFHVLLQKTKFGRKVYLIGINRNTAEYSGIKTKPIIIATYVLSGISAAVAGIYLTGYLGTAKADFGNELTLQIITAVVLGGTSNTGGRGRVTGTALATVIIGIMRFGLSMIGISTQYLEIPVGLLLIVALVVRPIFERKKI